VPGSGKDRSGLDGYGSVGTGKPWRGMARSGRAEFALIRRGVDGQGRDSFIHLPVDRRGQAGLGMVRYGEVRSDKACCGRA